MLHPRSRGFTTKLLATLVALFMLYTFWSVTGKNLEIIIKTKIVFAEDNYGIESDFIVQRHSNRDDTNEEQSGVRVCSQKQRRDHVIAMCQNLTTKYMDYSNAICFKAVNPEMEGQGPCLLVDHQHKVAFCGITKSGSSSGIAMMMNYGPNGHMAPEKYPKGAVHSPEMKSQMGLVQEIYTDKLKNYTKFMIVRNPFDRLVSSYLDKMQTVDTTGRFKSLRLEISAIYGDLKWSDLDGSLEELPDVNVSFTNFMKMLLDPVVRPRMNDEHWATSALLCDPCRVHYDYIMRTESLHYDAGEFIKNVYHKDNLQVPKVNVNRDIEISAPGRVYKKVLKQYYDSVKEIDLYQLMKKYKTDFELYGYSFNAKTYETHCNIDSQNGICC